MLLIDFSSCENGYRDYGGSDNKRSIEYNGEKYMIKMPEFKEQKTNDLQTSHVNNVLSEYIGSHIINTTGLSVHDTFLGNYNGQLVVACKDFTGNGYRLQEFSWLLRTMYDKSQIGRIPTYKQLNEVIEKHPLLTGIREKAFNRYWDTFVVDALIGNFDRHKGNWGYLVNEFLKNVDLAPIYDCGSCLYPGLSEDSMKMILDDQNEIQKRIYEFPKAALNKNDSKNKENKFGYYEMLSSDFDKNCTRSLKRMYPKIDMNKINEVITNIDFLSDQRVEFYLTMLKYRKELILDKAINLLYQKEAYPVKENVMNSGLFSDAKIVLNNESINLILSLKNASSQRINVNIDTGEIICFDGNRELSVADCVLSETDYISSIKVIDHALNEQKKIYKNIENISL